MTEQAVAHALDHVSLVGRCRFDRQIAFRIEPDRAIVQIGRADAQQSIIHDHDLGMNHDIDAAPAIRYLWAKHGNALGYTGLLQDLHETDPACPHDQRFEPGMVGSGYDQHDFELRPLAHALGEAAGQGGRGQKLVLDVDRALGAVDRIEEQRLDFADLLAVFIGGGCARNADIDIAEIGPDVIRPRIAEGARAWRAFACPAAPALARKLRQCQRSFAIDDGLNVMDD